jgi:predicted DNA-binding transcriptional regulator AlpA
VLDPKDILTKEQLQPLLGYPADSRKVYELIRETKNSERPFPYMKLGGKLLRFSWKAVSEWLEASANPAPKCKA